MFAPQGFSELSAGSKRSVDVDPSTEISIALFSKSHWVESLAREFTKRGVKAVTCAQAAGWDDRYDFVAIVGQQTNGISTGIKDIAAAPQFTCRIGVIINPDLNAAIALSLARENAEMPLTLALPDLRHEARSLPGRYWRNSMKAIWPEISPADFADELFVAAGLSIAAPEDRAGKRIHESFMRIIDIIVGLGVMTLGLPVMLLIAFAIRVDSRGAALFSQRRVGKHGKSFTLYKFRTMAVGTRQAGTHEVPEAAVTQLGVKLRHLKLDELPQAWNLLKGDLTLVGPRPCLPVQVELVEERHRRGVLVLKPGLTGLAQISEIDMSEPRHLARVDAMYASLRGIALDLQIIIRTFMGAGRGDHTKRTIEMNAAGE